MSVHPARLVLLGVASLALALNSQPLHADPHTTPEGGGDHAHDRAPGDPREVNPAIKGRPRFLLSGPTYSVSLDVHVEQTETLPMTHTWAVQMWTEGRKEVPRSLADVADLRSMPPKAERPALSAGKRSVDLDRTVDSVAVGLPYYLVVVDVLEFSGGDTPKLVDQKTRFHAFETGKSLPAYAEFGSFDARAPFFARERVAQLAAPGPWPVNVTLRGKPRFNGTNVFYEPAHAVTAYGDKLAGSTVFVDLYASSIDANGNPPGGQIVNNQLCWIGSRSTSLADPSRIEFEIPFDRYRDTIVAGHTKYRMIAWALELDSDTGKVKTAVSDPWDVDIP